LQDDSEKQDHSYNSSLTDTGKVADACSVPAFEEVTEGSTVQEGKVTHGG